MDKVGYLFEITSISPLGEMPAERGRQGRFSLCGERIALPKRTLPE